MRCALLLGQAVSTLDRELCKFVYGEELRDVSLRSLFRRPPPDPTESPEPAVRYAALKQWVTAHGGQAFLNAVETMRQRRNRIAHADDDQKTLAVDDLRVRV